MIQRIALFLLFLLSNQSNAILYDIYSKYEVRNGHQLQDIAWDSVSGQMFVFFEPEPICEEQGRHPSVAFVRPVHHSTDILEYYDSDCNPHSPQLNAHQGYDIEDGKLYMHPVLGPNGARNGEKVYVYVFDSSSGGVSSEPPQEINLSMVDQREWSSKALATDGEYLVTAAHVLGDYYNVVVHIYKLDTPLIDGKLPVYKTFSIDDPSTGIQGTTSLKGGVQGIEVVNDKFYLSFGGLEEYGAQANTQVRQYDFEGVQTGLVTLAPKGVMSITNDQYNFPHTAKMEHEGLTVKDGIVYAGLYYKKLDGLFMQDKHLLYEAFDSTKTTGDGWFYLKNQKKGMCLNAYGVEGDVGANVTLHPCVGSEDQIWNLPPLGVWGVIKNHVNNTCLNVVGTKGSKGSNVNISNCAPSYDDQHWMRLPDGRIVNKAQGFCLNPEGTSGNSGENINITECSRSHLDQRWNKTISTNQVIGNVENSDGSLTTLVNKAGGTCLDSTGFSGDLGKNVYVKSCDGLPDQQWMLPSKGKWGYIKNAMDGACLNPYGTSGGKKANVNLGRCVSGYNDLLWKVLDDGRIINKVKGYCLNPKGTAGTSGSNVNLYPCDSRYKDHYWH